MSLLTIIRGLERIHNSVGQLNEIRGHLEVFHRAAHFNPRNSDDWDLFGLRDNQLSRIIRVLERMSQRTRSFRGASETVRNDADLMNRLFFVWADAHAANGPDARQTQQAQVAFYRQMVLWGDEMLVQQRDLDHAQAVAKKMLKFYQNEQAAFTAVYGVAAYFSNHPPTTALGAQATAYALDFERVKNLCGAIVRNFDHCMSKVTRWRNDLRSVQSDYDRWSRWSRNRRNVERDVDRRRAPR